MPVVLYNLIAGALQLIAIAFMVAVFIVVILVALPFGFYIAAKQRRNHRLKIYRNRYEDE